MLYLLTNPLVSITYKAGWAPGPVWTGVENLASTRIGSPDRPARSESDNDNNDDDDDDDNNNDNNDNV
jgi:hypothetical protein